MSIDPPMNPGTTTSDQSVAYGRQFVDVYDRLFPGDAAAAQTARFLRGLMDVGGGAIELGVGTGRIAVPLAGLGVRVTGIDTSVALLERARTAASGHHADVTLVQADIRTWRAESAADLVYCVCGTISMLACPNEQRAVLDNAAASVRPGGHVLIETHSPARVRWLHRDAAVVTFNTDVPTIPGGLQTRSSLAAGSDHWSVEHTWHDGTRGRSAYEFSRLTEPAALTELAADAGLDRVDLVSSWSHSPYDPLSPTYTAVFRRPADRSGDPERRCRT